MKTDSANEINLILKNPATPETRAEKTGDGLQDIQTFYDTAFVAQNL